MFNFNLDNFANQSVVYLSVLMAIISIYYSFKSFRPNKIKIISAKPQAKHSTKQNIIAFFPPVLIIALGLSYFFINQNNQNNSSPTATLAAAKCTRENPYNIPTEFQRAISLIDQRVSQYIEKSYNIKQSDMDAQFDQLFIEKLASMSDAASQTDPLLILNYGMRHIKNCLDIKYDNQFDNIEGYFTFDKNKNIDDLIIGVSNKYENNDDLLTAFLSAHEVTHATNYYINQANPNYNSPAKCLDDETWAYTTQIFFLSSLNNSELDSISSRLKGSSANELKFIKNLVNNTIAENKDWQNWLDIYKLVKKYVNENPLYIDLCQKQN